MDTFPNAGRRPTRSHPTQEENTDNQIIEELVRCAGAGWCPEDLRHELGPEIETYFGSVVEKLRQRARPELLSHWIQQPEPTSAPLVADDHRSALLGRLVLLGELRDWGLLSAVRSPGTSTAAPDLTQAQQRARHRMRALLLKAGSTPFPDEARALTEKADMLRRRHWLDMGPETHCPGSQERSRTDQMLAYRIHLHAPWIRPQFRLLSVIARAHSCESQLLTTSGIASVLGGIDDVARTRDLFISLSRQRDHLLSIAPGAGTARVNRRTSAYRRTFLLAYATRIERHLARGLYQWSSDDDTCSALGHHSPGPPGVPDRARVPENRPGHRDGQLAADRSFPGAAAPVCPAPGKSPVEQVEHRWKA